MPAACLPRRLLAVVLTAAPLLPPTGAQGQAALAPAAENGKRYALLVGVRKYDSIKFDALRYTENDVEELGKLLSARGGFTSVRLLTTTRGEKSKADAPTADNVRAALKALLARKTRHDLLLVALSGHGVHAKGKGGDESFFCPCDAQLNDTDTLVSLNQLVKDLDACGAGVKILLADACRNDPAAGRNVDVDTLPRLPRGTAALFSCKSGERAFESPKLKHGVFFYHVLQGLRGKARNDKGEVTWPRLAEHVTEAVSEDVPKLIGGGARQTPEWKVNLTGKAPVLIAPSGISPEAEKLFKRAVERTFGRRGKVNWLEAARLARLAADKGHPFAEGFLGFLHSWGGGVKKDEARASELCQGVLVQIREAAARGSTDAQHLLGHIYRDGLGPAKDYREALRWYRLAAEQNTAHAQSSIGWMYQNGFGVGRDYAEALRWYRLAAKQNDAGGQYNIGWMYQNGLGVAKDSAEALRWMSKAAEQDFPPAQNNIGVMYHDGLGVEKDYAEAIRWYRKAVAQDESWAQNNIGDMYFYGRAVAKDEAAAAGWYRKAAEQGLALGQFNLGWCYENGRGVTRDLDEARRWYRKAAAQGHADARKRLAALE
jgi:TPR repeat protein